MEKIDWNKILDLDKTLINCNGQHSDQRNSYGLTSKEHTKKIYSTQRCSYQSTSKEWTMKTDRINENQVSLDYSPCSDDADSGLFLSFDTDTFLDSNSSPLLSNADELIFWSQAQTMSSNENSPENISLPVSPEMARIDVEHAKWSDRRDNRAENVNHVKPTSEERIDTNTPSASLYQQPSDIPQPVLTLVTNIKSQFSDHAVVYAIAAQMCQTVLPMDAYVSLKIALLLSLISIQVCKKCSKIFIENKIELSLLFFQSTTDVPPISIMAVGPDSSSVFKIMNVIGKCAQK